MFVLGLIQRSVRTWLLANPHSASSGGEGANAEELVELPEPPRPAPPLPAVAAPPPPPAVQEGDDDPSCVVCLARPRAVVLLPCRHLSMCALCAADVPTCPMCRGAVEETMVVFV